MYNNQLNMPTKNLAQNSTYPKATKDFLDQSDKHPYYQRIVTINFCNPQTRKHDDTTYS